MSNGEKFFKLGWNGKNVESGEYASWAWLKRYFDTSWSLTKLTMPDLKNVLDGIQSVMFGLSLPKTNAVKYFFLQNSMLLWLDLIKVIPGIRCCRKMWITLKSTCFTYDTNQSSKLTVGLSRRSSVTFSWEGSSAS